MDTIKEQPPGKQADIVNHRGRAPHYYPLYFSKLSHKVERCIFNICVVEHATTKRYFYVQCGDSIIDSLKLNHTFYLRSVHAFRNKDLCMRLKMVGG